MILEVQIVSGYFLREVVKFVFSNFKIIRRWRKNLVNRYWFYIVLNV